MIMVLKDAIVNQESDTNDEANEVRKLDEYKPLTRLEAPTRLAIGW